MWTTIPAKILQSGAGSITVVDVDVQPGLDSQGTEALDILLTFAAPEGDTWPTGDVLATMATINKILVGLGLSLAWNIHFVSEHTASL